MNRLYYLAGWGYAAICGALVLQRALLPEAAPVAPIQRTNTPTPVAGGEAAEWFRRMKPYCNTVELKFVTQTTPPEGTQGAGYLAACYALAGKTDESRKVIDRLDESERIRAAAIVFEVGHPVADAGDDRAAGPIMELVIDYWPNHYMALYHAGMSEYMLGQAALAKKNLTEFIRLYSQDDGWRHNAQDVLARLNDPSGDAAKDLRRPPEP